MKHLFPLFIFSAFSLIGCGGNGDGQSSSSAAMFISSSSSLGASSSKSSSSSDINPSSISSSSSSSESLVMAPVSLANKVMFLTIERVESSSPTGTHPTEGVFVLRYGANGTVINEGIPPLDRFAGVYSYTTENINQAIDHSIVFDNVNTEIETHYSFSSPTGGSWLQRINTDEIVYEGSFTLEDQNYPGFAPTSLTGMSANLILEWSQSSLPPGSYPPTGEVAHIYNTSENFSVDGSRVGMPAAMGTYGLTKLSLDIVKDSGFNQTFNVPYEIIYTFNTLTSGTFTENFGNGTILWTGSFTITPINE